MQHWEGARTCRRRRAWTLPTCYRHLLPSCKCWSGARVYEPSLGRWDQARGHIWKTQQGLQSICVWKVAVLSWAMHWQTWQEKSIADKPPITSFLPLMKMHFIFKGFSIKMEHLLFFSEMILGCIQLVEFTVISLNIWNVPTDLLHSLLAKKVSDKMFHSVLPKMRGTLTLIRGKALAGSSGWQRM